MTFGGVPVTLFTSWTDNQIQVVVPQWIPANASIAVVANNMPVMLGFGVQSFSCCGPGVPTITSMSTWFSGDLQQGSWIPWNNASILVGNITITGSNLQNATAIIGDAEALFNGLSFGSVVPSPDGTSSLTNWSLTGKGTNTVVTNLAMTTSSGAMSNSLPLYIGGPPPTASIWMNGVNITGTTQTVVVGQQISLSGVMSDNSTPLNSVWAVGGTIIDQNGYTPGKNPNFSPNLSQQNVTFYWIAPGSNSFVSFAADGGQIVSAFFNVVGPTVTNADTVVILWGYPQTCNFISQIDKSVLPTSPLFGITMHWLFFVTACPTSFQSSSPEFPISWGGYGIRLNPTIQDPDGYSGNLYWEQVLTNYNAVLQPLPSDVQATAGCSELGPVSDGPWPYNQGPDNTIVTMYDAPGLPLFSGIGLTSGSNKFTATTYLLWQPLRIANATPVPLGSVQWAWNGNATFTGNNWNPATGTPAQGSPWPQFQLGLAYPTWGSVAAGCSFISTDGKYNLDF